MTCIQCNRVNLPGGIRCAYCGAYLPEAFEFDLGKATSSTPEAVPVAPNSPDAGTNVAKAVGVAGPLIFLLLKLKSLASFLVLFGKIGTTFSSMLVYIWVYAQIYGWRFAVGITLSIFIHEMGHVFVNWRYGLKQSAPVFIPFLGAAIFLKNFPDNPKIQAESGAGGPIAGFLAALGCYGIYAATGDSFWLALAHFGFLINLFNLIPLPYFSLDGAHIHTIFSPGIWNLMLGAMILWAIKFPSIYLWAIIIVSFLVRISYKDDGRYLLAPPQARARMAIVYALMCISMSWATDHTTTRVSNNPPTKSATSASSATKTESNSDVSSSPAPESPSDEGVNQVIFDSDRFSRVRTLGTILLVAVSVAAWVGTVSLLKKAKREAWTRNDLLLLFVMSLLLPGMLYIAGAFHQTGPAWWQLVGGCLAGNLCALIFASYCAIEGFRGQANPPTGTLLRLRTLLAFGAGVFLVGYGASNGILLGLLVLGVITVYAGNLYLIWSSLGNVYQQIGDWERAAANLEKAAQVCPDPAEQSALFHQVAKRNLGLYRGAAALDALNARETRLAHLAPLSLTVMMHQEQRAMAFGLMDRFDEALTNCEQMLQTAHQDTSRAAILTPLATLSVHSLLAQFALFRGWHDEAIAQADWCLKYMPLNQVAVRGILHALRAEALLGQAMQSASPERRETLIKAAERACDAAAQQSHDTGTRAYVAVTRAQIALLSGDNQTAKTSAKRALDLLPGHLACRYWYGRIADPETLRRLGQDFPEDHYGRLAATNESVQERAK